MSKPPALKGLQTARSAWLRPPPALQDALKAWCSGGGTLALLGQSEQDRRRVLQGLLDQLHTQGAAAVRIEGHRSLAWSAAELVLRDPSLPGPPVPLPRYRDPLRLAQAVAGLLAARAEGPLWVVVDDLDRMDPASVGLLRPLAALESVHMVIGAQVAPGWVETTLTLPTWTPTTLAETVGTTLGAPLATGVCDALVAATHGHPEALLDLLERCVALALLDPTAGTFVPGMPPLASVCEDQSSDNHTGALQRVGQALALLCLPTRPAALAHVLGLAPGQVREACEALAAKGLVRLELDRVVCTPTTGRMAPPATDARELHEALATALVDTREPSAWLVPHLVGARSSDLAGRWAADALEGLLWRDTRAAAAAAEDLWGLSPNSALARVAIRALADAGRPEEALAFAERALARAQAPQDAPSDRAAVCAESARLHLHHLRDASQARTLVRAARRSLGGDTPPLTLLVVEARLHAEANRHDRTLAIARAGHRLPPVGRSLERKAWLSLRILSARALAATQQLEAAVGGLQEAPEGCTPEERERLWVEAAQLSWRAGHFLAAADAYEAAAHVDRLTHGADPVVWMERAGTGRYQGGDRKGAVATWTRALALAQRAGTRPTQARIQTTLCSVLREVCRFQEATRHGQQAFDTACQAGSTTQAVNAAMAMGDLRLATQQLDDATAWYTRCGSLVERNNLVRARGRLARRWAEVAVLQGDPRADEAVAKAIALANHAELPRDAARATVLEAVLCARSGRTEPVEPMINRATAPLVKQGAIRTLAEVRLWAAQAWLDAGRPKRAIEEAAHAVVWADEVGHLLFRNRADDLTARAQAASRAATPDGNRSDLERLLDMAVSLGRVRNLNTLLREVAHAARHLVKADRAFVVLGDADHWQVAARSCASGHEGGDPSHSVIRRTLIKNAEVAIQNVEERNDLREQDSIVQLKLRSAWCFPLCEDDRTLGALYADSKVVDASELVASQRLLRALASQASVAVTNARLLSESQQRAEEAADIAHDMRSPLSSVVMASEQLGDLADLPDWVREVLGEMATRVRTVLEMAERFLDERPNRKRVFDLTERVERLTGLAARSHRHLQRTVSFESTGPAIVLADDENLDRCLNNLINNALEHTPAGTGVQVRVLCRDQSVDVIVRDHGPGIPEHVLPRLFDRGEKGNGSQGYGLGLNIARRLAEENGGTLRVHNPPEGGAQFTLSLPLSRSQGLRSPEDFPA